MRSRCARRLRWRAGLREAGHETVEVTIEPRRALDRRGRAGRVRPGRGPARAATRSSLSLHGPAGRTAASRGCSRCSTSPTPAPTSSPRRSAWTSSSSRDLLARHEHPAGRLLPRRRGRLAEIAAGVRAAGLGEARPARLERRHRRPPPATVDARRRGQAEASRPAGDRRGRRRPASGGRVLAARQRGARRLAARARSSPTARLVRLRGQVRGGRHGAARAREHLEHGRGAGPRAGPPGVHALRLQRPAPAATSSSMDDGRCWSTSSTRSPASPRRASTQALRGRRHRLSGALRPRWSSSAIERCPMQAQSAASSYRPLATRAA